MIRNTARIGNFTSSEIVALTATGKQAEGFGVAAITYILETNFERCLGRSIDDELSARPLVWGKLLEQRAFDILGTEYAITSEETDVHPSIPYWAGSKDGLKYDKGRTVADFKCPMTLKSFCQLVQPLYDGLTGIAAMDAIRNGYKDRYGIDHTKHKDGEKFYWQLVSNAIINDCQFAELIPYMPYESELEEIKVIAQNVPTEDLHKHYWIAMANDGELPFINDQGYYKNLNIIRFEVPQADKDLLTANVLKAGKMLRGNEVLKLESSAKLKTA